MLRSIPKVILGLVAPCVPTWFFHSNSIVLKFIIYDNNIYTLINFNENNNIFRSNNMNYYKNNIIYNTKYKNILETNTINYTKKIIIFLTPIPSIIPKQILRKKYNIF